MHCLHALPLQALQEFSKGLLLARRASKINMHRGELLLHGSDSRRPCLLEEILGGLEYLERRERRGHCKPLVLLLLLMGRR